VKHFGFVLLALAACGPRTSDPPLIPDQETPLTRLTSGDAGEDRDPEISPDGSTLFFASTQWSEHYDLYAKPIGGTLVTRITTQESDERFPKVNPKQASMIAFSSNANGEWDIFVIQDYRRDPSKWVRVSEPGTDDIHPSWSPDGTRLVYSSTDGAGEWVLKVVDVWTGRIQVLEGVDGLLPEWNPKDNRIVFQRMRHRGDWFGTIWTLELELDGVKSLNAITDGTEWAAINPSWSRDGEHIVFATVAKSRAKAQIFDEADDLWVVRADASRPTRLTTDAAPDWMPVWSPVEDVIFFVSRRDGRHHIWSLRPVVP
jgi:TolB protein